MDKGRPARRPAGPKRQAGPPWKGRGRPRKPQPEREPADAHEPRLVVSTEQVTRPRLRPVWIYDNMVAQLSGEVQSGETVYVYDRKGKFLGSAIYNEASRIRARIYALERVGFDEQYLERAIGAALERRRTFFSAEDSFRVVFGDADGLPGLVVDKISGVLVVQPLTLAVNRRRSQVLEILRRLLAPKGMVVRFDVPVREKEGLSVEPPYVEGLVPAPVAVEQDGFTAYADALGGQKTGLFLDQRFNRRLIKPWCAGKRVLDLFCYVGAWSFTAALAGAQQVVGVDSSEPALELARKGAATNGFSQVRFECADVFDYVAVSMDRGESHDVIVCDPPAFAKTRKQVPEALRAYLSINYRIMKLVPRGGILATCSCSQHVTSSEFQEMLETAARNARMRFHIVARGSQAPDHPVLLGFEESEYLKCFILQRVE